MHGAVFTPSHSGDGYLDFPFETISFLDLDRSVNPDVEMHNVLNAADGHGFPQTSKLARNLLDAQNWLADEADVIQSIKDNMVINHTTLHLPTTVVAITTMFIRAIEWNSTNIIVRCMARWMARGFVEVPDMHFNQDAMHAPVVSDNSLYVTMSTVVTHELYFKWLEAKTTFLTSPLFHKDWVRFSAGFAHFLGCLFAKLAKSWH